MEPEQRQVRKWAKLAAVVNLSRICAAERLCHVAGGIKALAQVCTGCKRGKGIAFSRWELAGDFLVTCWGLGLLGLLGTWPAILGSPCFFFLVSIAACEAKQRSGIARAEADTMPNKAASDMKTKDMLSAILLADSFTQARMKHPCEILILVPYCSCCLFCQHMCMHMRTSRVQMHLSRPSSSAANA